MLGIYERGFGPQDRSVAGQRERNSIVGAKRRSAIGTFVERSTRCVQLLRLLAYDALMMQVALAAGLGELPQELRKTLALDQGTEMACQVGGVGDVGIKTSLCATAGPWQRGINQNTNGLLRQYIPKATNLTKYSANENARVENEFHH